MVLIYFQTTQEIRIEYRLRLNILKHRLLLELKAFRVCHECSCFIQNENFTLLNCVLEVPASPFFNQPFIFDQRFQECGHFDFIHWQGSHQVHFKIHGFYDFVWHSDVTRRCLSVFVVIVVIFQEPLHCSVVRCYAVLQQEIVDVDEGGIDQRLETAASVPDLAEVLLVDGERHHLRIGLVWV